MFKKFLPHLVTLLFLAGFLTFAWQEPALAGTGDNVSGYAWSNMDDPATPGDEGGIGWISFNSTNCDPNGDGNPNDGLAGCIEAGRDYSIKPIPNYGVNINSQTGNFSGYAWSENIGWISFAPSGPYPSAPNYSACLDFSGPGQICDDLPGVDKAGGWARALAYGDGWDGWIKLRGSNYGVDFTTQSGELSGYAWSDMVIGWISFKGVNYVVVTTAKLPPSVSTAGETWSHCSIKEKSAPILSWNYSDGIQAAYQIQIDDTSAGFPSPEVDTGEILSSGSSYAPIYIFNWDTNYWWRVKVKNQQGVWSGWSNVDNFNTPEHAYPWVDFSFTPTEPTQGETIEFSSSGTETFGGAGIFSYLWTITQGAAVFVDNTTANDANPHISFSTLDNKVKLQVTDTDNYSCSKEKDAAIQLPLPEYKEAPPIIWLKKLFAGLLLVFK